MWGPGSLWGKCDRGHSRGLLALIGGSEDRHDGRGLLARIVEQSQARSVAIVPAASLSQEELVEDYLKAFGSLGVSRVRPLSIRNRQEADDPRNIESLESSDLVFFTGGSQERLLQILDDSHLLSSLRERFRQGAAVAGTSAGAAAIGEFTIFFGDHHGTEKDCCLWRRGLGLLDGVVVDTHFLERNRFYRLAQFLASGRCGRGIGLPENTAVLVGPDGRLEVAGSGVVTAMDAGGLTYNDYGSVDKGQPVAIGGLRVCFLPPGTRFDLHRWEIV